MKTAIMQPYLFPYIGYWQLINAVDQFIILDDVNYITRGYINRNNIIVNGKPYMFSIPIEKASQNKLIMETRLSFSAEQKKKWLQTVYCSYRKASEFNNVYPLLEKIIQYDEADLVSFIEYSILEICNFIGTCRKIYRSSQISKDNSLTAQDRIIDICERMNTSIYVNPAGGRKLYKSEDFQKRGMELCFIDTKIDIIKYKQYNYGFISNLSIIDILMFNNNKQINDLLQQYTLNKE